MAVTKKQTAASVNYRSAPKKPGPLDLQTVNKNWVSLTIETLGSVTIRAHTEARGTNMDPNSDCPGHYRRHSK